MDRRDFLKLAAAMPALPVLLNSCSTPSRGSYAGEIKVFSDMDTAHLVFQSLQFDSGPTQKTEVLIVGGGIAGVSAAAMIGGKDFLLCELSSRLGGTSASAEYNGISLAQGAHYDLEYPDYYGRELMEFFEQSGIIYHQPWKRSWAFVDEQYVVPDAIKNKCFQHGDIREDVLQDGPMKESFLYLLSRYDDKMPMPTRLIDQKYHGLDKLTFLDFLKKEISLDKDFIRGLDYHMLDDWGGTADQVSALAGIHYFKCRPYYREIVQLFSPPQGNSYFVDKMAKQVPNDQLLINHLVKSLKKKGETWEAEVIDVVNQKTFKVLSDKVIYAGQKHALKFVCPSYAHHFAKNEYAPWLVISFILNKPFDDFGYWQNEMIVDDQSFLGFINSNAQHATIQDKQVLTAYYCFPSGMREFTGNISKHKHAIVEKTMHYISAYFGKPIEERVESVLINAMGHAMAIPKPGHLFNDINRSTAADNIAFAGVDHARLPILMEAVDSGLEAVKALKLSGL